MAYTLIIAEKPSAAQKIAQALADGKAITKKKETVPYYELTHNGEDIVVTSAVGHLYSLNQTSGTKWGFPVFDIEWAEAEKVDKDSKHTAKFIKAIKSLAKDAKDIVVACDYDQEGSVIGKNIVVLACGRKDGFRMKFSTLTTKELRKSYAEKTKHLDWPQINAGEARHKLDWYNGINYSRALTSAIKAAGSFKIMSTGRVQGPALKIIVDKEKEIRAFIPEPFWVIQMLGSAKEGEFEAWHTTEKFTEKKRAQAVMKKVDGKKHATVTELESSQFKQAPPTPFDLTTMQIETYRTLRISPKMTLSIAQELYTAGWISYPRTSSQKLPVELGLREIIAAIAKQPVYKDLAGKLLSLSSLKPNEGPKDDPAHPSIYPTGEVPGGLTDHQKKLYDLIVRRFLATFGEPAVRETNKIFLDCNTEPFVAKGTRTVFKGWHEFYGEHVKLEEENVPELKKGELVDVKKITLIDKETQPPKRYSEASIIKELEKRNLGTKATRASIVDTLFNRGYVQGKSIEATEFGIKTADTLAKYAPKIVDEELTRHFENEMEDIQNEKRKPEQVLQEAKVELTHILSDFRLKEKEIGEELKVANRKAQDIASTVGTCPVCKAGILMIKRGKFGKFIACNKYPECKVTAKLPSSGGVKVTEKTCESCVWPMIMIIRAKRAPQTLCINPDCATKKLDENNKQYVTGDQIKETPCPKCTEGKMVLRKSIYGQFLGCSRYPKCKNTQKLPTAP